MKKVYYYHKCIECGSVYPSDKFYYVCPKCENLLLVERDEDWIDKNVGVGKQARLYIKKAIIGSKH